MKINIRNEEVKDYKIVEEVAREAFWNLYIPGCYEHLVIHNMRNHKDFIKELAFVIEVEDQIVGGIFYTHSRIVLNNNKEYKTISFGPVFILPEFHRKGLGKKLITHSIQVAKEIGYKAILTLGYPYHYEPYGFLGGKKYNISMSDGKLYKGLLALPLYEGALEGVSGYADFSDVFEVLDEDVEEFDKSFTPKKKKYQKSQDEYKKASCLLDE